MMLLYCLLSRGRVSKWWNSLYFWEWHTCTSKDCPSSCKLTCFHFPTSCTQRLFLWILIIGFHWLVFFLTDWLLPTIWCSVRISNCSWASGALCKNQGCSRIQHKRCKSFYQMTHFNIINLQSAELDFWSLEYNIVSWSVACVGCWWEADRIWLKKACWQTSIFFKRGQQAQIICCNCYDWRSSYCDSWWAFYRFETNLT